MTRLRYPLSPELTDLVLAHLPACDVARALTVNNAFFDNGIHYVWRSLPDARPLLMVLVAAPKHGSQEASIPNPVPAELKRRFDMYAACVREFRSGPCAAMSSRRLTGVETLLSEMPVVPAVRTIRMSWDPILSTLAPPVTTIMLFLGASTRSLRLTNNSLCALDGDEAVLLLERAFKVGSPLEDLELFTLAVVQPELSLSIVALLDGLRKLSTLSLSARLVSGRLLDVLGQLPGLRALTFDHVLPGAYAPPVGWSDLAPATDDAVDGQNFSSLRALELRRVRMADVSTLIDERSSMFGGLTTLAIHLSGNPGDRPTNTEVHRIFTLVSTECPLLNDFTCTFPSGPRPFDIDPSAFAPLGALDLERLTLVSVRVLSAGDSSALHGYWPRLTHLVMPEQPVVPADLLHFSGRSTMQELQVLLSASQEALEAVSAASGDHPASPAHLRLASDSWLSAADDHRREMFARFLFRCWPNVTLVFAESRPGWPQHAYDGARASFAKIVDALQAVQG
ncbi:hypothetical protein FRC08_007929 [Ceratobasidium sp. 394]|nr:hypothetical protein FRC08_007929 [Ceratobasidium sp. 394]